MSTANDKGVPDGATSTVQHVRSVSEVVYDNQNRMTLLMTIVFVVLGNRKRGAYDLLNLRPIPFVKNVFLFFLM